MKIKPFNKQLCQFLDASPTPFHATAQLLKLLIEAGFQHIKESDDWSILFTTKSAKGKYVVTRNDSSIVAFNLSGDNLAQTGLRMVGAHTDSPCLKVKPNSEINKLGYLQLGVEVYGGALLNPWFDRDLSLAGRVSYDTLDGKLESQLIDFRQALATIPSLAIHLDREANKNRTINSQTDILPIILQTDEDIKAKKTEVSLNSILLKQLKKQLSKPLAGQKSGLKIKSPLKIKKLLAHDLYFYDTQKASINGLNDDFISSARLDNLLSCFIAVQALIDSDFKQSTLLVCNDHEEVGSQSASGAQGNFLASVLERVCQSKEVLSRCLDKSLLVSADNAHGIHPNYSNKHDQNHGPILNKGPVIKINANQRYASNSVTVSIFQKYADDLDINFQQFVVRSDMGCGSTIGPLIASLLGVKTVDIGIATFAMHSIRELAGSQDPYMLFKILRYFNNQLKLF
jgi:aspartyl aminopeptidase